MFVFECFLVIVLALDWAVFLASSQALVTGLGVDVTVAGFWIRVVAITFILGVILLRGESRALVRPGRKVLYALLVGSVAFTLNFCGLVGLKFTTISDGAIITKLDVLFTLLASRLILKEKMTPTDWVGTVVMTLGTVLIMWDGIVNFELRLVGDLLFVLVALCLTFNAFVIKTKLSEMPNPIIAAYNSSVTFVGFTVLMLCTGGVREVGVFFSKAGVFWMTVVCGVSVGVLFVLYYRALSNLPFWLVRVLLLFVPAFAILIDCVFVGRSLDVTDIVGACTVAGGAGLVIVYHERKYQTLNHGRKMSVSKGDAGDDH